MTASASWLGPALVERIGWSLVHSVWQLAAVAVVAAGVLFLLAPAANQARAGVDARDAITGIVVTPDEKPVAGADVWLVAWAYPLSKADTLGASRTDEDGRFRLVPDEEKLKARNLGWRALWAHKPGLRPARIIPRKDDTPLGFEPGQPVRFTFDPPVSTTFRVLDPGGKPLAGATVAVVFLNNGRAFLPDDLSDRLAKRTVADGTANVSVMSADLIRLVRVTSESFGTQNFHSDDAGFKPATNLLLQPAAPVDGRVEDVFEAAAVVDPARAATLIDSSRDSSGLCTEELKNSARLAVARILARPADQRSVYVDRNLLHVWPIESEEAY
jgi:hypothetical protein